MAQYAPQSYGLSDEQEYLQAYEDVLEKYKDERDRVQKKTFTKWINQHLLKVRKHINDLYEDLRDGHNLISLLEVLSGDTLPRERDFLKTLRLVSGTEACAVEQHGGTVDDDQGPRERGRMRFHRLQNVQIALDYLKRRQVKLVNIRNDDITDGNPKLTLGLIWTIILHFQISEIHVTGESQDMTAKERLLFWSRQITDGYVGVRCDNFTTSWRDGRLFNAIIHKYRPDLVDMSRVSTQANRSNLENAFCVAEQLGVARLLDPEDVDVQSPDEKSVITYVSTLYDAFPKVPDGVDGISPNDVDIKWVEYQNMIKYLSQWIRHNVAIMSDRSFPNNPVELKALYTQYLQFKEHEIPLKENEKTKIKNLYKMLEMWIEFGRIQLPQGHHPNDVEKEWGKLIVAMLEREKSLRPEVERLEMLQQIANRVQRDCVNGEDKLSFARTALQSDAKRLESGIQFLNEAEIAGYLLECENILRQQVVDIQILLDGKFPFADQLVQRVSELRDELLALRAECSSVYSKGRTLTTEQTKMMISGITQSLNSGYSQNINASLTPALTPAFTPGGLGTPGSTITSSLTPCLTPSFNPSLTPGLQPASVQSYMDPGSLRHLKNMQIRKPLLKSSLADPNMTEEEVNMKFLQDLLSWVEEMQLQLDRSEWGSDLPSVEMHLDNHKSVHRAIEEFQMSLKDAKLSEIQMTIPMKITYSDKLNKLEKQYERLLSCSRERQSHLESLHDFVSEATQELIWLNEKEEEEVAFDWSDRNGNISKKRDYHADLMRELDEKEEVIKSVQDKAERLMLKNHPARLTIEAYRAAMHTQWSWILQLCSCVEQHLKENAVYFEFFRDAKESMDYLKSLQDAIQRKYSCDRSSSLHRLDDLIQESMDEKEQLLQYRSTVAGLVGRAKNIVQLRPRNPESPVRSSIPVKAICDYRQIEITIYKEDECVLASNSHRAKWKVINPAGNEAMVPSVCFTVPPPNKEAVDMATRTEQLYQNVLALWHHSHINMKSVASWHYLMSDIRAIRNWNVASIKTMLQGEHQQVLSNLQSHFEEFLEDSEESEVFTVADCAQLERDVADCKEYYKELLRSAEREEHEESVYNHYISEIRNFRMHLEAHEEHLIRQLRTPLERDDLEQSLQRITEHERKTAELNKLKEDLDVMKEKCELFLRQAAASPSVPTLSSELTVLIQSMSQVYSMSSIYMDKLKTVSLVVRHSQSAEALVKAYESKLYEEDAMNSDVKSIETVISTLKQWRTEIDEKQEVVHDMEDELQRARVISDRMFKAHNERDFDLDWHKEKADQLSERWQNIHSEIDSRLRDLDGISKSLKHYGDSYGSLDEWVREMEAAQIKAQENKPEDSKALAELLNKQKVLVAEIEQKQSRIDECQKYSEQYSSAIKDYELQLMTFRAMVDSQHKSPLKKRRMQSSSDAIQQEFMDLRTRYTALVTLMTQYVKFASETLKRTEDEERSVDEEKREHGDKVSKLLHWMSNVKQTPSNDGNALKDSNANTDASNKPQVSVEEMVTKKEQIAEALRATQMMLNKHNDKMTEEEREKAQEQLKTLNQAYSELSQHCSDQTTSAEESLLEKHKEFTEKLEEVCDDLTLTENQLMGHQQQAGNAECVTDLQQYQQEHQALQKDVLTNASALNDVITSTKKFLEENRSKLMPDQIAIIESKLEEAKSKAKLINQRAEESRKDLEKVVTTAIKQESEKAAAVERLEESKNKIEGLLDWISNIGNENESDLNQADHISKENGNLPEETSPTGPIGADDDANGNALQATENDFGRETGGKNDASLQLDKQCDRVKARHQEILSQQQDLIMATQSAQALLDKQANVLSPEEKEKLQKNIQELKGRYEASLTQAEQQMKQVQCVQEELKKFQGDCEEFVGWLDQAEGEIEQLGTAASSLNILSDKLQRQRSFSEDVISHKGDLRFITMSGQKVLDVANTCGLADSAAKNALLDVDTSGTCSAVKDKLDSAASRYKSLHSQCNQLGNNLKDVVDKYKKYDDSNAGLLKWLNSSEEEARKQQSEAIAADPQTLQKQLEETKALQGQMTGHQTAIDTLRKAVESLITSEGDLLSNSDDIQETVDDIVERYDNLSKSVSDRNEKLQITLTRSMSVQDGLDEMMGWMEGVEASVKEKGQIPLDSASIGDILSKEAALEQDIASRQSSISAMKAKVKKFVETADPSAAALLQTKMDALSQRFSDSCNKHKQKVSQLEQLKEKVEQFEKVTDEVQQFVVKRSQDLHETEGPGKTFNELSQLMQNTKAEMAEHASDLEKLQTLSKELSEICPDGNKAQIQSKMDNLSNIFSTFKDTVNEKEEEVSSCQDQLGDFRSAASALTKWLEQTNEKVPVVQPSSSVKSLEKDLLIVTGLLDEWTFKDPAVQDLNSKGSALYSLMTFLTSPAKTKTANKSALTNGGGPASHSYLTNKELMVIQQNMSFINEGYASLGETLKGRAAELSSLVQEVKEAQKETDNVLEWLRDMKKTAASWNNAATEKDSVKTQLEQQKAFEDDMKQKQEKLQKLRETLLNLIRTHPNSPEAAKWKQMLAEIDAAWADISGSVEDRKQHLEQSNKNLDIFQTTERQLVQWLSEKELMMSVLGPLSIDPNMLKMQKQQVQILQNEFKSRKPQYEQLEEAASAILSSSGNQDPSSGKLVREQLTAVTQKWQGLTGQLNQRDSLIDQAVVKTGQFQELLKSVSQTATQLENQLTNHQGHSTQPEAVKKQLEDVHNISAQLREERKKLKEAEAINAELTAMVTEDYLKADLARQLDSVSKPFKQLEEKAEKRIEHLNSTFASSQQFQQTSKDFQSWLGEKLHDQSKPQPISAKVDILQQTLEEHSKVQKALSEHKEAYNTITGEGEMLLQNTDGAEKLALQGQLTTLSSNWEEVKKSSVEQADKLQTALQKSLKYQEHAEKLSSWIQEIEASEGRVKLTVDPVAVESSISQVKALQKDVDKHRGMAEQLNAAADSLLEVANADTDAIEEEKASIGKRVDNVVEGLQSKRESLEKISHTVKDFNDAYKEAKGQLEGAKKQVVSYESQGVQAHSNKNLTNMKAQQKSLEGVQNQVEHLKTLAKDLVVEVPDADGVTDLLLQADSMEQDYSTLNKKLEETCQVLEGKLQGIGQFQNQIREMFTRFTDLDDELDSMAPVDLDLATLKEQQDSIQTFVAKLQEVMANTANAGDSCKKMLETETSPDLLGLKRDLDALSKQSGKLLDRAKGREVQVQNTLTKLEELYGKLHQAEDTLCSAVGKEAAQEAVGMETDGINQQLEAFKAFQKEDIDPLKTRLQDISSLGQSLIQNAAKGTSTKKLEDDLEEVNTKWNTLNKKIAERSAQLHEALLHCGRFQDALESLLSWLTDTEELVANQKPPSAEFKVVKAQIQEQKLLQRLLDDRKPTVELIKKEGERVAELAESVDKEKVAKEIECLGQRWDTLLKKAENRHKQLEIILVVTQQFHETLEPLSEWLAATEKHLANSEPIGTETSKLEDQISQHKALEEETMNHSKDLLQAVSLGQMLKTVSSVDEKESVQSKLDSIQASYIELQERCRRKAEMLQQALANAQVFGEDEVALMNWLNEVHSRLSQVSVEDYKIEVLEKQLAEQWALQSDIVLRKKNVDQAISNGMELLKQTTGDEVVVIQGKLDGIKTKYAEINSTSDSVLKTLERVSDLSTKLQHTHEDLSSWLEKVEAEVSAFADQEPAGEQLIHAQSRQKALLKESKDQKPAMDKLNELSSSLLDLIPWHTRESLDRLVTEDNERYRAVCDTVTQQVEQINADILKSQQFEQAADTELSWLTEAERKLLSMGEIRLEQDQTTAQLQAQKIFSMDIMRHKDAVDGIVKTGKAIMNSKNPDEKEILKARTQTLLGKYGMVSQLNSERCLQLERAQSMASQFWETYEEMWPWLQETLSAFSRLPPPSIEYETLRQQQEELRQMRELIAEHKPHIDKMNKTGPQLLELSPVEGVPIREKYTATDQLYTKLKADVKQRAATLDDSISKSTQFHDKIDPMLESLERIAERLRQPPSISVEVEKIREQITENKAVSVDLEKLQPSYETLRQRGEEMIARSEGADKDISAKVVQDKLDQMVFLWSDIQALMEEREAKLLDVMDMADKFWCDHCALIVTIKDSQDLLRELEEPGVDPSVVKQQQEFVEGFKEEIDGLQEELEVVQNQGAELMTACGEPDKPVIRKSLDEVNSAWENLNKAWKERVERLEEAMQAAVQFQDGLQGMFDWVDILEGKLDSMSPVGTDLETVKQQISELKEFKGEAYQLQIEMERLNHQAGLLLKKVTDEADRSAIQEPMSELKMLWENLDEKIISRQHKLEGGLLALGQFQHALDELLAWMSHTEELLNDQRKAGGDPKAVEIELAKHHVLQNDVLAHKATVETVNKAGNDLVESTAGEEASSLQIKLESLNQRWKAILEKSGQRKQQLQSALLQAQGFHGEIEDMQQWLKDTERQLLASKAVGGLPDTAREQLNAHLELCSAFEVKEELYQELMNKGQQLLAVTPEGPDSNTEQDLANLQDKWEAVQGKSAERKVKLEEALTLATDFHNSLQDFINWLTQAEQTLNMVSPASLILDTIMFQIDEHKMFVTEVNSHREQIIELDKTGTHLKYFSQKQDVVLIKNLLLSVQGRWEKLVQRSVERGRLLDDARKRAKQFHETWNKLMEWLDDSEKTLDSEVEIANDPDKIKTQLSQHKEFQKAVGSKHSVYDTTTRTGRALKDKTSLRDDNQKLDDMLSELRDKWDTVCGKSVERQNKLEEALLFSGQFTDALQALIDWLYRVEPQLAEDQPVHGDIDLVLNLIDNHKVFQKELGKRTVSVQALKRSAKELIESSHDDSSWVKAQMQELSTRWETVCNLSVSKQARLEQALCQAEEFHSTVHILLEWLAEAEQSLRFHGSLPDDEEALQTLIEQHKEFMKKLEEKRAALNKATSMGEAILVICHPDSITTIKHWNTIIKARLEEVQAWARQHQQRLATALTELLATQDLLENLLTWLQWAETNLNDKDKEQLPQELEEVKGLIAEHQAFMEEMTRKQPDVDKITKTHKRKAAVEPPIHSHIPVLDKGRTGRKRSPTQTMYASATQPPIETKNPRVNLLVTKWQHVWLLALDRRRKLNDALDRLEELKEFANFDFDVWRKRYMRWMNHKKSRVMDFFRRIDKDQDGKVTRQEFIEGILSSKFPTSRLEMSAVADIFDRDGDGYIDYYEFVAALHPNKDAYKPLTDADKIEDEVTRQVAKCKCTKRFQVEQIGANKYRFYLGNQFGLVHCLHDSLIGDETIANRESQNLTPHLHVAVLESCILFGDSQQLRLVRILRSTVMVRVGGGWMALDEFLVKNDPCRVHHHGSKMLRSESNSSITQSPIGWQISNYLTLLHEPTCAKGRTNLELREKFILPEGTTQVMASFRYRGRRSRPSSRAASPNRSTSSQSCAVPSNPAVTSTPKTPQHIVRNYDKPWLTNSKPSTPLKSSDSFGSQGSSSESTPVQGSKLRLPGYLSGKGFQSGEEGTLISAAVLKARTQMIGEPRKNSSRPGSKAGSRGSSRRGSDASDFDISDIQSVCSDVSETVGESTRATPRSTSRQRGGKPSKIPTPQRRATPTSKLAKASKR
ncbi:dystonin isoform X15 [Anarrhichthys ocellatus]|uniref:dystonin isoform X15 n=1 Tax=Anarrhichthys ocellatus TaxID=433405 RepID=UPI0012ECC372|nr:dystonin isoform X15 [Anarrhichthys ocellatus]